MSGMYGKKLPLAVAVAKGFAQTVQELITMGADVAIQDPGGPSLYFAASSGKPEIVEILLKKGLDINEEVGGLSWSLSQFVTNGFSLQ